MDEPTVEFDAQTRELEEEHDAAPGSVLSQLRELAAVQQQEQELELPVGGSFGDLLRIVYHPLGQTAWDRFTAKRNRILARNGDIGDLSMTDVSSDLMAQACVCLVAGADGKVVEDAQGAVRLEHRLALLLDMPRPNGVELSAREVIMRLFGGNAAAIDAHSTELMSWLINPGGDDLGEASAESS